MAEPGDLRRDRRRVRAGPGGDGGQRLVAGPDPPGRRHRPRHRAAPEGPGRAGSRPSTRPARSSTRTPRPPTRHGSSSSTWPARGAGAADAAEGLAAGLEGGPRRPVRDARSTGAQVFADSLAYAKPKPSFAGYDEYTTILQAELDENVFNAPNKTAKEALDTVAPQLDAAARRQLAPTGDPCRARSPSRAPPHPRRRRSAGRLGRDTWWAWLFLAPTVLGLALLSAGPILASFGISLTELGPAHAAEFVGLDNFATLLDDDRFCVALRNTAFFTPDLGADRAGPRRWASRSRSTSRSAASPSSGPRTSCRSSPRPPPSRLVWAWIYSPQGGLLNAVPRRVRHPGPEVDQRPVLGDAVDRRDERLAGPGHQRDHLPGGPPGDPAGVLRRGGGRRRRRAGRGSAT